MRHSRNWEVAEGVVRRMITGTHQLDFKNTARTSPSWGGTVSGRLGRREWDGSGCF